MNKENKGVTVHRSCLDCGLWEHEMETCEWPENDAPLWAKNAIDESREIIQENQPYINCPAWQEAE